MCVFVWMAGVDKAERNGKRKPREDRDSERLRDRNLKTVLKRIKK